MCITQKQRIYYTLCHLEVPRILRYLLEGFFRIFPESLAALSQWKSLPFSRTCLNHNEHDNKTSKFIRAWIPSGPSAPTWCVPRRTWWAAPGYRARTWPDTHPEKKLYSAASPAPASSPTGSACSPGRSRRRPGVRPRGQNSHSCTREPFLLKTPKGSSWNLYRRRLFMSVIHSRRYPGGRGRAWVKGNRRRRCRDARLSLPRQNISYWDEAWKTDTQTKRVK